MKLILASQSPRRKALMELFHIPFFVIVADIDETMDSTKSPYDEVARLSLAKALAVPREPDDVVVAADTIVVCQDKVLGKPADRNEAKGMLRLLSGRDHQVMTGLCVLRGEQKVVCTEVADIHFRTLSEKEIDRYVASGEPDDKAGAYAIQGGAALFVSGIHGDYYNVMGLPVCRLGEILRQIAPELLEDL